MKGITIVEMIIALVIVSMMMAGIFAANHAIMSMDRTGTAGSSLFIRAQVIVDTIKIDAVKAVGTISDHGFQLNNTNDNSNYFCFRQELSLGTRTWACYTRLNNVLSGARVDLHRCAAGASPAACAATDPLVGAMITDVFTSPNLPPAFDSSGFSMKVITRENPAIAKSSANPEVSLDVAAYPEEHSW